MVQTSAQGEKQSQGALRGFQVNSQRLQQTLDKLSEFGRNPEGGVTRLGFSEADMAAREYVMGLMRQAGLAVRVDAAGNIFGRRPGTENLPRSEEHTSELQSRLHLVCRLLLEKKKQKKSE